MNAPNPLRVASLLPSATEIVCGLGARASLVGISHECDFPRDVEELPVLTRARLAPVRSSQEIDREVRHVLQNALAVYELELDRLEAARPDVIVTQDLCDVCAVSFQDVCSAVAKLARRDVQIVNLHPTRLSDIWSDIQRVASALDRIELGARVIAQLRARVGAIALRAAAATRTPRILSIEWIAPVMIGGMWMPDLIDLAHAEPLVTRSGEHAPTLTREQLEALDPDVVLVKPCGFDLARTLGELPVLRAALPWTTWRAAREGRVFVADGNAYFNRPGPRIVESLEILAACAHPELFEDFRRAHDASVVRLAPDLTQQRFSA